MWSLLSTRCHRADTLAGIVDFEPLTFRPDFHRPHPSLKYEIFPVLPKRQANVDKGLQTAEHEWSAKCEVTSPRKNVHLVVEQNRLATVLVWRKYADPRPSNEAGKRVERAITANAINVRVKVGTQWHNLGFDTWDQRSFWAVVESLDQVDHEGWQPTVDYGIRLRELHHAGKWVALIPKKKV